MGAAQFQEAGSAPRFHDRPSRLDIGAGPDEDLAALVVNQECRRPHIREVVDLLQPAVIGKQHLPVKSRLADVEPARPFGRNHRGGQGLRPRRSVETGADPFPGYYRLGSRYHGGARFDGRYPDAWACRMQLKLNALAIHARMHQERDRAFVLKRRGVFQSRLKRAEGMPPGTGRFRSTPVKAGIDMQDGFGTGA